MAHGTQSPRGIIPSPSHASLGEGKGYEGHHMHPAVALQRSASAHAASRRVNSADLRSQGLGRDAPHPVRSAPRLTTTRPTSNTVPRRAAPPPLSPPPPPAAGAKSSPPPPKQHWMEHGVETEAAAAVTGQRGAAPPTSASTKHGAYKRGGHTGGIDGCAAADVLLEQLTGLDNTRSREIIRSFVQGQQAAYKGQLEAMDKQANAYTRLYPPTLLPASPPVPDRLPARLSARTRATAIITTQRPHSAAPLPTLHPPSCTPSGGPPLL